MSTQFLHKAQILANINATFTHLTQDEAVRVHCFIKELMRQRADVEIQERLGENPTLTAAEIKRELGQ